MGQVEGSDECFTSGAREPLTHRGVRSSPKLVLIVATQPLRMLDVAALLDAFSEANRITVGSSAYDVRIVSGGPDRLVTSRDGTALQAAITYKECFERADTLLIAGSGFEAQLNRKSPFLTWLSWQATQSRRVGAVSNATLLLAETGLLDGKHATIHWQWRNLISARYPRIRLDPDSLYVRDANMYTCAGGTAALDLALALIEEDLGSRTATAIAESMLLYLRRSGATPQISPALQAQAGSPNSITELLTWLPGNLQRDLSIKTLARRSAMSPRNFARLFVRQVGLTPARHIENLRLEAAQFHLESTQLSTDGVALATGLGNAETLRRLFVRRLGITPGKYRRAKTISRQSIHAIYHSQCDDQSLGVHSKLPDLASRAVPLP